MGALAERFVVSAYGACIPHPRTHAVRICMIPTARAKPPLTARAKPPLHTELLERATQRTTG